jgi:hypothetical protein
MKPISAEEKKGDAKAQSRGLSLELPSKDYHPLKSYFFRKKRDFKGAIAL